MNKFWNFFGKTIANPPAVFTPSSAMIIWGDRALKVLSYTPWMMFGQKAADLALKPIIQEMRNGYKDRFATSEEPELRGDIEAAREKRWPKEKFPELYIDTPDDIAHPIVMDGRLVDGSHPATELTAGFISNELVDSAATLSWMDAKRSYQVYATLFSTWGLLMGLSVAYKGYQGMKEFHHESADSSLLEQDFLFEGNWYDGIVTSVGHTWDYASAIIPGLMAGAGLSFLGVLLPVMGAVYYAQRMHRIRIHLRADASVGYQLRGSSWESIVRWKYRQEQRNSERIARLNQAKAVSEDGWDSAEPVLLGKATGVFEYRGSLSAPKRGQSVAFSPMARQQHLIVLGQSGTGKTSRILKPLFEHDLKSIKSGAWNASIFLTDGKGTLYEDLMPIAEKTGLRTVVIGTGPGCVGIDLTATVKPRMFCDLLRSVGEQADGGSGSGDSYWVHMAAHYCYIAAKLLEAWERTEPGIAWSKKNKSKPYSPQNILKLATERAGPKGWGWQIIIDISESPAFNDEDSYGYAADLSEESLYFAMDFYTNDWKNLSDTTLTGIQSNVTKLLSGFVADEGLRINFGSGAKSEFDLRQLYGKEPIIVGTSLSSTDSFAHRLTLILLKSILYLEAFRYNKENKDVRGQRQVAFYGDEFQDIITKDLKSISDATAINKLRGAVSMTIATQTVNALEQAVGDVAARNFIDQFSTVISFRQRDDRTIKMLQLMGGRSFRNSVYDSSDFESYVAKRNENDVDVFSDPTLVIGPLNIDGHKPSINKPSSYIHYNDGALEFSGEKKKYTADMYHRYLPGAGHMNKDLTSHLSALQTAAFRAEDKNLDMLKGAKEELILRDEDMQLMGSSQAVAFWNRGGHMRMDIVEFDDRRNT